MLKNSYAPDTVRDELTGALNSVKEAKNGTLEHKRARQLLEQVLKNNGFETFRGRHESMPIGKVGESAIVEVESRRGTLSKYHGKTLRLAVVGRGTGRNGRIFAAKEL